MVGAEISDKGRIGTDAISADVMRALRTNPHSLPNVSHIEAEGGNGPNAAGKIGMDQIGEANIGLNFSMRLLRT